MFPIDDDDDDVMAVLQEEMKTKNKMIQQQSING